MKPLLMATLCHRGRLFTETIGYLQSAISILFLLVTNALLNRKGQPIIQVRFHSTHRIVTFFCSVHVRLLHCKMHAMFCCGKLCALVLSLCDFTFYSCKGDDDIKIQRRHIKLGNNELKKQFATTDR